LDDVKAPPRSPLSHVRWDFRREEVFARRREDIAHRRIVANPRFVLDAAGLRTQWHAETWLLVKAEFSEAFALKRQIRHAGVFIHENAPGVNSVLSDLLIAASINHPSRSIAHDVVCDRQRRSLR
jgi:hypothetical protein